MAQQFANRAVSALAAPLDDSETEVELASGASFSPTGVFQVMVDEEIMRVTTRTGNVLTVVRGTEGTTAATHAVGTPVKQVVTKEALESALAEAEGELWEGAEGDLVVFANGVWELLSVGGPDGALVVVDGLPAWATLPRLAQGANLTDADGDIQAATANLYVAPAGVQTTARTSTLLSPTDVSKRWLVCIANRGSFVRNVTNGGVLGGSLSAVAAGCAGTYRWDGNDWNSEAYWNLPPL